MLKELFNNSIKKTIEEYTVKPQSHKEEMVSGEEENFPTISINSDTLPEIEDWKDGEDYIVVMKLTQNGSNSMGETTCVRFQIKEIACVDDHSLEEDTSDSPDVKDYVESLKK